MFTEGMETTQTACWHAETDDDLDVNEKWLRDLESSYIRAARSTDKTIKHHTLVKQALLLVWSERKSQSSNARFWPAHPCQHWLLE